MEVAKLINPELCEGAFERRPCRRKLRYIGYDNWPEPTRSEMNAEGHDHLLTEKSIIRQTSTGPPILLRAVLKTTMKE